MWERAKALGISLMAVRTSPVATLRRQSQPRRSPIWRARRAETNGPCAFFAVQGSSIPTLWRSPTFVEHPLDVELEEALSLGYGSSQLGGPEACAPDSNGSPFRSLVPARSLRPWLTNERHDTTGGGAYCGANAECACVCRRFPCARGAAVVSRSADVLRCTNGLGVSDVPPTHVAQHG
eukprot:SAG11_NODE_5379_length_1578_cov_1.908722_2_plen_179_part_00